LTSVAYIVLEKKNQNERKKEAKKKKKGRLHFDERKN
jgi:hypothetical protein